MYCSKCGAPIPEGMSVCTNCGAPVPQSPTQELNKSPITPPSNQGVIQQPADPSTVQPVQPVSNAPIANTNNTGRKRHGMTIVALILAISATVLLFVKVLNILLAIPAIILSIIALVKKDHDKARAIVALCLAIPAFLLGNLVNSAKTKKADNTTPTASKANVVVESQDTVATIVTTTTTETTLAVDPIVGNKTSFKDLGIGEIGKKDDVYVGLQYVKQTYSLPTRVKNAEPENGNAVILAFFEFYNGSDSATKISPSNITCYVDGTQVGDVKSNFKVFADGIHQVHTATLDPGCQLISVQDFEVPEDWQEIKFYYQSECVWTISKSDVHEEKYQLTTLISADYSKPITKDDDVIASDGYDIQYKGVEIVRDKNIYTGDLYYVVFKFHITNNSNAALDTDLFGYNMRCYQDNLYLGNADYTLDKTIDGYIDIHDVDSVEPGMSADIYVAFETRDNIKTGDFYMIFDDGYIYSNYRGYVYVKIEE